MPPADLTAIVLCGGKGTRAYPYTAELPKPLLEVAGRPILWHVLDIYARQGVNRFVLAAGFRGDALQAWVSSLTEPWEVEVVDTGEDALTGKRIERCRDHVGERFFATYGDGLADVDLAALLDTHDSAGAPVTFTIVPLPSQYGTVDTDGDDRVVRFKEKPILNDHWINGGFFVMEQSAFDHWRGEDLEKEVLPYLAESGHLQAYRHHGFWKSMDTYKDAMDLTALAAAGDPPWLRRPGEGPHGSSSDYADNAASAALYAAGDDDGVGALARASGSSSE